ncbi:MAG: hypothetical protein M1826_000312 [Phylliscum demangeonii]|nr:MAG: hypothetical protein M1826_000312 [Phylliscum demangeonii]
MAQPTMIPPSASTEPDETNTALKGAASLSNTQVTTRNPPYEDDPFRALSLPPSQSSRRFSNFDSQRFDLSPSASPAQAKRTLEAHLLDTDRRIQDASKLGTSLVQQRQNLSQRLKEVELQQSDGEIGPELRQKLIDFEAEYNDVVRESARAFLGPRSKMSQPDGSARGADGQLSGESVLFSSQAVASPSKMTVPSRRARNQPTPRAADLEFVTDIGTSLIAQVWDLQNALAEKDEIAKTANLERSRLEGELESLKQRLRSMDESEQRYKDENWNLETQTHELMAAVKEANDRENRVNQALTAVTTEKNAALRELDDLMQANGQLSEDHTTLLKQHDIEVGSLRKATSAGESERDGLSRKVQELMSQNHELAKAVAGRMAYDDLHLPNQFEDQPGDLSGEKTTPEHSPPPSPTKGTPRHGMLESETLKSSLHHAHRMIQNLKGTIHREKTEKVELKRMLQDARDELEIRRHDGASGAAAGPAGRRRKTASEKDAPKRAAHPGLLGAGRQSKSEAIMDDAGWEDHGGDALPDQETAAYHGPHVKRPGSELSQSEARASPSMEGSDAFETANEREDTATENERFETPAESLAGDSTDELTETEGSNTRGRTLRPKASPNPLMPALGKRNSYLSTASASDSDSRDPDPRTPIPTQQRYRMKMNRAAAAFRRSKSGSEVGPVDLPSNSPADSLASVNSNLALEQPAGQSLFAELGDFDGDVDGDESVTSTTSTPNHPGLGSRHSAAESMRAMASRKSSTPTALPPLPTRPMMMDAGTMTEPDVPPASPPTEILSASKRVGSGAAYGEKGTQTASEPKKTVATFRSVGADPISPPRSSRLEKTEHSPASPLEPMPRMPTDQDGAARAIGVPLDSIAAFHLPRVQYVDSGTQGDVRQDPVVPTTQPSKLEVRPENVTAIAPLAFSPLMVQGTEPTSVLSSRAVTNGGSTLNGTSARDLAANDVASDAVPTEVEKLGASPAGLYSSALAWAKPRSEPPKDIVDGGDGRGTSGDDTTSSSTRDTREPFSVISNHAGARPLEIQETDLLPTALRKVEQADHGSQTLLSSEEIENLLSQRHLRSTAAEVDQAAKGAPPRSPPRPVAGLAQMGRPIYRATETHPNIGRARARLAEQGLARDDTTPTKGMRRPSSSGSIRSNSSIHPPLPPDHKQAIAIAAAAAAQRAALAELAVSSSTGSMGPPLAPASAYKTSPFKPATPKQPMHSSPGSKAGTTPRPRFSAVRSEASSAVTRRSSVSSFASELDQRFNIRSDGLPAPYGLEGPGTDPQMIQAITQTMIGEYLWKYTRKAGRGQMSDNRHRRFFWVHPYTRTLYWSHRNPASGGRAELPAKSVAIEAVRVVVDDNPMPPGLHRKSLVVITPGRTIKFTAATGQRHNTWFNALSYLLLRTGPEPSAAALDDPEAHLTTDDVNEFNPSYGLAPPPRAGAAPSISSYASQATRNVISRTSNRSRTTVYRGIGQPTTAAAAAAAAASSLGPSGGARISRSDHGEAGDAGDDAHAHARAHARRASISRLSRMFRPASNFAASMSSRRSRHSAMTSSIYDAGAVAASNAPDSAEDLRAVMAQQESEADRLENVRACCDGKHDVGSLAKRGSHVHSPSHSHA